PASEYLAEHPLVSDEAKIVQAERNIKQAGLFLFPRRSLSWTKGQSVQAKRKKRGKGDCPQLHIFVCV
ncbi:MAG: hypothetical protein IKH11_04245, partial [Bacteroidales bacterium]|nr:hypothetical protein [Bacteroidales bacterium]